MGALRQSLFEILEGVKSGKIDSNRAVAAAKVAQTLLNSVETQLKFVELQKQLKSTEQLADMDLASLPAPPPAKTDADLIRQREMGEKKNRDAIRASLKRAQQEAV